MKKTAKKIAAIAICGIMMTGLGGGVSEASPGHSWKQTQECNDHRDDQHDNKRDNHRPGHKDDHRSDRRDDHRDEHRYHAEEHRDHDERNEDNDNNNIEAFVIGAILGAVIANNA